MRASIRKRGRVVYHPARHSQYQAPLERDLDLYPGGYIAWESQGVTNADGGHTPPCYVLWAPEQVPIGDADIPPIDLAPTIPPRARAPRRPKTTKHKNITRVDHAAKRTYGYFVRIQWKGQRYQKFFADHAYGDRLAALDAALEWRNATERAIGKPHTPLPVVGKANNPTGHVGIRRRVENHTDYYEATWRTPEGKTRRTRFSVRKHGERKALRLALKARALHERHRIGG